jgi:GNAT superfamily N-acetyltransferase
MYKSIVQNIKLEHCTDDEGDYINLLFIRIKKKLRNKGYGSAVISEIIQLADQYNVRIKLWITDVYGSDLIRLSEFYKKHDMILIKNNNMIYFPKTVTK